MSHFQIFSSMILATIENVTEEKSFGIVIDNKLNFIKSLIEKIHAKRLTKNSVHSQEYQN